MIDAPRSASVVVVGGGIVGSSVAYHLAKKGLRDVLVLERGTVGSGSSGKNAGGIRLQFSNETNVRLSQLSIPRIERFADEMGVDPAFHQVGYLILITEEDDAVAFERALDLWRRLGVPARRLSPDEALELVPQLNVSDVRFATFCPKDGYADPSSMLLGYLRGARELGVRVLENAPLRSIEVEAGRVRAVGVDGARIACETVVDAAGAWGRAVGALAGVDVPVDPSRRMIFVTEKFDGVPAEFPMLVDFASGLYMHRESGGVLLGMGDKSEGTTFDEQVNWEFLPSVIERALYRLPVLAGTSVKTGWAGLYENTPDANPILGRVPDVDGFICACGFSGHGVMHAPATGSLLAELVVDGRTSLDISTFGIERFRTGRVVKEHNVI